MSHHLFRRFGGPHIVNCAVPAGSPMDQVLAASEPAIRNLVAVMNRPDVIQTRFSCEGHFDSNWLAYVMFETSLAMAGKNKR